MIRNASTKASSVAMSGSKTCASACSPSAPIASDVTVTPSCIAAMKRGGSEMIRSTARAAVALLLQLGMRVRRAVTRPYSAATKKAFSRISAATARSSKKRVTPRPVGVGTRRDFVVQLAQQYRRRGRRHRRGGPRPRGRAVPGAKASPRGRSGAARVELRAEEGDRDLVGRARLGAERCRRSRRAARGGAR